MKKLPQMIVYKWMLQRTSEKNSIISDAKQPKTIFP